MQAGLTLGRRRSKEEGDLSAAAPRTPDFDTIPELGSLQESSEFQALSSPTSINDLDQQQVENERVNAKVQLSFCGVHVLWQKKATTSSSRSVLRLLLAVQVLEKEGVSLTLISDCR